MDAQHAKINFSLKTRNAQLALPSSIALLVILKGNALIATKAFTQTEEFVLLVQNIVSNALRPMAVPHVKISTS